MRKLEAMRQTGAILQDIVLAPLRYSSRCITEGATAALDIALTIRNSRVPLLWRTFPRGSMGFRIFDQRQHHFEALTAHHRQFEIWAEHKSNDVAIHMEGET